MAAKLREVRDGMEEGFNSMMSVVSSGVSSVSKIFVDSKVPDFEWYCDGPHIAPPAIAHYPGFLMTVGVMMLRASNWRSFGKPLLSMHTKQPKWTRLVLPSLFCGYHSSLSLCRPAGGQKTKWDALDAYNRAFSAQLKSASTAASSHARQYAGRGHPNAMCDRLRDELTQNAGKLNAELQAIVAGAGAGERKAGAGSLNRGHMSVLSVLTEVARFVPNKKTLLRYIKHSLARSLPTRCSFAHSASDDDVCLLCAVGVGG